MPNAEKSEPDRTEDSTVETRPRRLSVPISAALMWGFGVLVFVAVAGVLSISLWSAQRNTLDLLSDKAELELSALVERMQSHLDPVSEGNAFLAGLMARGEVDPADHAQLVDYMTGAMAATPQVRGMSFIDPKLMVTRAIRSKEGVVIRLSDWSGNRSVNLMMENSRAQPDPYWGQLFWSAEANTTLLNRRAPVWRNGEFLGVLLTAVSVTGLSRYMVRRRDGGIDGDRFILYGSDYVLAHPAMVTGNYRLSDRQLLPSLSQIDDPVLARLWDADARRTLGLPMSETTSGHGIQVGDDLYIVLFRDIAGYGPAPLRVGAYVKSAPFAIGREMNRLILSGIIGLVILLVAIAAARFIGRRISRPVRNLALAAEHLRGLDFAAVPELGRSRLRELDQASMAFNAMVRGLKSFENDVPPSVVRRVVARERKPQPASEERSVTVLFTDIGAFTGLAKDMSAVQTASFLNRHFSMITSCVEAEQGTVDKYIGDSVMAFWGAPAADADASEHACRTALAIRRAITLDNESRSRGGEMPIRVRIGIHAGRAIVGNIGPPGRVNYTLIGDAVNVAERLQLLCKDMGGGGTVEILLSGDVVAGVGGGYHLSPLGPQTIPGRHGTLKIYRLD